MFTNILLPVDGSMASLRAARQGIELAKALSVKGSIRDDAHSAKVQAKSLHLCHQHPHRAIVDTSANEGCDLIVMD